MDQSDILDKIREVNGPIPELEPQIVKSRHLLTYYAGVLLRRSEDDYLDFCMAWGLPVDWMGAHTKEPLEPNEVAFTPEGQRMILSLTQDEFHKGTYAAHLLRHLIKLGPESLTPPIKKKLFELTKSDHYAVRGPTEWNKDVTIEVPSFFLSLLRAGYFRPEDEKIGRDIAEKMAHKVIEIYYQKASSIENGGKISSDGLEKLMACASQEANDDFMTALKTVVGERYRTLNSRSAIDAINKLKGPEQRRAIEKHGQDIANLLRSIPLAPKSDKRDLDWYT